MVDTVFCNAAAVKTNAPISSGFGGFDTQIGGLIASTSVLIKNYCRRKFDKASYVEFKMANNGAFEVRIKEPPILAASVILDYDPSGLFVPTGSYLPTTLLENTDYVVNYENGRITILADLEFNMRGVRITYVGGYDHDASTPPILQGIPQTLITATSIQTSFMLSRIKAGALGEEQQAKARSSLEKFTVSSATGLLSEVEAMLVPFRAPLIGRG